jgi:hypothetical protein
MRKKLESYYKSEEKKHDTKTKFTEEIGKNKNTQVKNLNCLYSHNEGLCNFLIFMKACTPHINKRIPNLMVTI